MVYDARYQKKYRARDHGCDRADEIFARLSEAPEAAVHSHCKQHDEVYRQNDRKVKKVCVDGRIEHSVRAADIITEGVEHRDNYGIYQHEKRLTQVCLYELRCFHAISPDRILRICFFRGAVK